MEFLPETLEAGKVKYAEESYASYESPSINASWSNLDKYNSLREWSQAYIAAVVLPPTLVPFALHLSWTVG